MSEHAKLSPSSASRWLHCPGSISAIEALPEVDDSSVYADEGTFAHQVAERALTEYRRTGMRKPVAKILDEDLRGTLSDCGRFECDQTMRDHLLDYVEFCAGYMKGADVCQVEAKVHALKDHVYGTADFFAVHDNVLEVADLKYGAGVPVRPENNAQARIYALGVLERLRDTRHLVLDRINTVRIHIFQPRNAAGGGVEELQVTELERWCDEVLTPGVEAADGDPADPLAEPPRVAGEHCRFCPAKGSCYALKDAAMESAAAVFDDPDEFAVAKRKPDPRDLTVDQVGKALSAVPLVETWIKALREHAYDLANAGKAVPGFKLVRKVGNRRWSDEGAAAAMLREMLPEGESVTAKPKLLSPAQAEKKLDVLGKALVNEYTTKPDAGTALVPESDKRPAFTPGDVFTNQEEPEE